MVQVIIFDFYGVLAINGWQAFKAEHFRDRVHLWDEVYTLGRQVDVGLSDYEELVRFTAEVTGETEATVRYQLEHTVANGELLDFIQKELKGSYKLGILSNASRSEVIDDVFTFEQRALFDTVILSRQFGLTKPDLRIYEIAAEQFGASINDCLFIDDQERLVAGAKEAGMQAVVYQDMDDLKQELMNRL